MKTSKEYIDSGILEMYVLGLTTDEENIEITKQSEVNSEIAEEIERITENLILYAESKSKDVDITLKPMLLATIDYMERVSNGEEVIAPPILTEATIINDFSKWLDRKDMVIPSDFVDFHAKLIGHNQEATTAIAWLKYGSPHETHHKLVEKFYILEGTCDIVTDDGTTHSLVRGDYFSIPLHVGHYVKVTSEIPCKLILQRIAA